ncbi:MAG: hypothetical protein RXP30_02260 [Thermoplasmata archaeon]|jgi:K+/H+ antiporter YhaU regulatory subunit KhtT|nr:hypothetical protein [Thermoplasmata archaeon]MVT13681.1 hypothetical protein [Euryarchaeota archaeon]MVT15136.1 hypothetical protein [Euryarchaeota archaeon]MVT36425.1 hypothetical protein [Euryarchaeota archaeon]
MEIFETPLPGLGTKVTFKGQSGEFSVISKFDGSKEIYFVHNENIVVLPLQEEEARILAMLLLETYYQKKEGKNEINLGKSILKWIPVYNDIDMPLRDYMNNALFLIREGKIERNMEIKPKKGDIIVAGE